MCPVDQDQEIKIDHLQHTRQRGIYAAGNATTGLQSAILAAAEGYKAAYAINEELIEDMIGAGATSAN